MRSDSGRQRIFDDVYAESCLCNTRCGTASNHFSTPWDCSASYPSLNRVLNHSYVIMNENEGFQLFTSVRYDPALLELQDTQSRDLGWNTEKSSPLYMLNYHQWRMLEAARHWGWTKAVEVLEGSQGLERLETFVLKNLPKAKDDTECPRPRRVKILLSREGELRLESSIVPATAVANLFPDRLPEPENNESLQLSMQTSSDALCTSPPYDVYVDKDITSRSDFTHHKTTKREMYDQARERANLKPTDTTKEVLVVNHDTGLIMEGSLTTPYFWRGGRWVTPPVSQVFSTSQGSGGQNGTTRRWALERSLAFEEEIRASDVAAGEGVWLSNGVRGFIFGRIR